MKTILLLLTLLIISINGNTQINLVLTGNCSLQGVYATTWADEGFWGGNGTPQSWNTPNLYDPTNSVTGDLVIVDGINPVAVGNCTMDMACNGLAGFYNTADIVGKIAVIRRGSCEFGSKALAVQNAGAIACIIVGAVDSIINMDGGADGSTVTIPTIMVSASAGIAICDAINQGCTQAYIGDPLLVPGFNSITGTVLYDVNNDNCATSTLNMLPYYPVSSTDGTNNYSSFVGVNSPNVYTNYVNINTYTTSVLNLPTYLDAVPNNDVVTFTTDGNTHTANFCITPNQTINDVNITFINNSFYPGINYQSTIIYYQNVGTNTQNGTITLNYDDTRFNLVSANMPIASQNTGQVTFSYTNLLPYESRDFAVFFDAELPPVNNIGDSFTFSGQITPISGDATPTDNLFTVQDVFQAPYDPNDIRVIEGSEVHIDNANDYLHYRVRFQNTGTAPAVNVVVNQMLDADLDWSTLQILDNSHPMTVSMIDDSVNFKFYNIYLPDSTADEVGSHGYFIYKIKPLNSVVVGDQITATADIYFDFNTPVTTNTALTTFIDYNSLNELNKTISIYPNPATDMVYIQSDQDIQSVEIYNQLGQLVLSINNSSKIDVSTLKKGIYFCNIKNINGEQFHQKIIKN